jgi:hypothetical protein
MQRIETNISLIVIMGLVMIVPGCINQDVAPNITQNYTITVPESTITAEVETGLVILSHRGGDDIPLSNCTITIEQGDLYAIYEKIGQVDNKFSDGDTLNLTYNSISLNDRKLNARVSINNSGNISSETTITLISRGNLLARIVSSDGFFS